MRVLLVLSLAVIGVLAGCQARPTAAPDIVNARSLGPMDIDVLSNDSDQSNRPLIVIDAGRPAQGTTSINRNSTIRYVPRPGATGEDHFSYRIRNSKGRSATGHVTVRLPDGAEPPPLTGTETPRSDSQPGSGTPAPASQPAATAAPANTPPPLPAPIPIPPPAASSSIQGIAVTLFTRDDDKNTGEPVELTIKRGDSTLIQKTIGENETWPVQSDRTEEFTLNPPVSVADAASMSLEVRKLITTPGIGESWVMQVDVQGRLADGRVIPLVPKSLPFRMGGGSSNNRTWQFKPQ